MPTNMNNVANECKLVTATEVEIISPTVSALVDRYVAFAKKSAENILELAKTLQQAKETLGKNELVTFHRQIGLNPKSSTYRKLIIIAEKIDRLSSYMDKMPAAWTTVYKLATMSDEEFNAVVSDKRFSPFVTAKTLTAIVTPKKKESTNPTASVTGEQPKAVEVTSEVTPHEFYEDGELYSKVTGITQPPVPNSPPLVIDAVLVQTDVQAPKMFEIITLDLSGLQSEQKEALRGEIECLKESFDFKMTVGAKLPKTPTVALSNESFQMEQAA